MTTIEPFNISDFVSKDETRLVLCKPWRSGEFVFAADGRVLIRVPATLLPEVEPEPKAPQKQCDDFFAKLPPDEFWQVPPPALMTVTPEACDNCDDGIETCLHCGRSGPCEKCDGTGFFIPMISTVIGSARLNQQYLRKLNTLPDLMLNLPPTLQPLDPVHFRFRHGIGVLMQMRKES